MGELISVIVAIYRIEEFLSDCIESIMRQTYKNLEIILVNDGSDDSCGEICDKYALQDSRIKVIHKKNEGQHMARQTGIINATGKYVSYIDGDDWIEPNMFERLYFFIEKYNVDTVQCGIIDSWVDVEKNRVPNIDEGCYINEDFSKFVGSKFIYNGDFFKHGIFPYMWSKLFVREKQMEYQLLDDPSENLIEDAIVSYPYIGNTQSIYITHECLYHYRVRPNSQKRSIRYDVPNVMVEIYKEFLNRFKEIPQEFNIQSQLKYYMLYNLIAKAIYTFDDINSDKYLTPFGEVRKKDKIVLYGAGMVGIFLENYINSVEENNLVLWVDRNYTSLNLVYNVEDPKQINNTEYDYIIISILSKDTVESAKKDLIKMGVPENKILWISEKYLNNPDDLLKLAKHEGDFMFNDLL